MSRNPSLPITGSHVGGTGVKPQIASKFKWGTMLLVLGVSIIPLVGPMIGHFIDRKSNGDEAKEKKEALTDWYRDQIALQMGIPASQVTYKDLELAAQSNPVFKQMIDKVTKEENLANRGSAVGAAIGTPLSLLPGAGMVTKLGEIAVVGGASVAAGTITKDELLVDDVATMINQKRVQGGQISASDVFMLRLAHDKNMQDQIKKQHGQRFHKMTPEQQATVMTMMPEMAAAAEKEAYAVNQGIMSEQDLTVSAGLPPSSGGFAGSSGRSPKKSFREQVDASRVNSQGLQMQPA